MSEKYPPVINTAWPCIRVPSKRLQQNGTRRKSWKASSTKLRNTGSAPTNYEVPRAAKYQGTTVQHEKCSRSMDLSYPFIQRRQVLLQHWRHIPKLTVLRRMEYRVAWNLRGPLGHELNSEGSSDRRPIICMSPPFLCENPKKNDKKI